MKNIAKIAALTAVLSVGNIEAKNIERTDAMHCASTDLQNLAKNIIRTDAMHRVSTATATKTADFTKSREKLDTETEPTPAEKAQAKELVETLFELADYEAMGEYLAKNGDSLSEVVLNEALKVVKAKISVAGDNANFARKEAGHYKSVVKSDPAYQKILDASIKHEEEYMAEVSHLSSVRSSIKDLLNKFNLPDNADKIGVKNMDPVFAGILENPKFEGTIKNNKELNDLVFAGFSPEFQKRFNELGLKVLVKKYPTKVKIYFVCGTDKNGEIYDVQVGDSRWKEQKYFILKDVKYGEVLAQTDDDGMIQEIREISPTELEKITIQKDGEISFSQKVIKNPVSDNKEANN